jgi:DNA-binding transcriptional regulator GbsR (MarR family)
MKFSIHINQAGVVDAGLHTKTDCTDWALLDYIFGWQQNPKAKTLDGKVWLNYAHIVSEMPLLGLRTKSSISNRIKKLRELDLIETKQSPVDQRLYVKTSSAYFDITQFSAVRTVHEKAQPVHFEERGVPEKVHSLVNQDNKSDYKNIITTTEPEENLENLVLTAEQQECFDWATVHQFWFASTVSMIRFLKVYNRNVEGGLKQQFDAHKKAQHATKQTGLNSEIFVTTKQTGGNYETRNAFNQPSRLSKHDQQSQRFNDARERAMAQWRADNNIIDI